MSSETEKLDLEVAEKPVETVQPIESEAQENRDQHESTEEEEPKVPRAKKRSSMSNQSSLDSVTSVNSGNGYVPSANNDSNGGARTRVDSDGPPAKLSKSSADEAAVDDAQKAVTDREPSISPPHPAKVGVEEQPASTRSSSDTSEDSLPDAPQLPLNERGPPRRNQFAKVHPYREPTEEEKRAKAERDEARKKEEEADQKAKEEGEAANAVAEQVVDDAVPEAIEEAAANVAAVPAALAQAADDIGEVFANRIVQAAVVGAVLANVHFPPDISADEGIGESDA